MKDLRAALMEKGYESREDKREKRDKANNAINKDELFKKAYESNKDKLYKIKATVDSFGIDKYDHKTKIVSVNTIHMYIDGQHYIANHTHLRGDKVKLDYKWKKGQVIELYVKIRRYSHGNKDKYELVNIF